MGRLLEMLIETFIVKSRWILAPLYLGLVFALLVLLLAFIQKFILFVPHFFELDHTEVIANVLGLVDVVLVANLVTMVMFSGYENFVSKIDMVANHPGSSEHPHWLSKIGYSDIKLKVIGSIVAISAVEMLKVLINIDHFSDRTIRQMVGIHLALTVSGVLFALMERLMSSQNKDKN